MSEPDDGATPATRSPLALLADPTRRRLFELIVERPRTVNELVEEVSVSQPSVSQHLRALREGGLVTVVAEANRRIYHPDPSGLASLRAYVDALWSTGLGAFAHYSEQEGGSHERTGTGQRAVADPKKHPRGR